jgi:hypothetical protein
MPGGVGLVRTNASQERIASIIREERTSEIGTTFLLKFWVTQNYITIKTSWNIND